MVTRIPGFVLQEADESRGLSQGGTNVLINNRPIVGKGETATTQIGQISAASVVRIEVLDAASLDLPGFSGLVANIVTNPTTVTVTVTWEPSWRRDNEPALLNGGVNVSGSGDDIEFSAAAESTMVRARFTGPEALRNVSGDLFETREEDRFIEGNQQEVSGGVQWRLVGDRVWNAKASYRRLDLERPQESRTTAITARGVDSLNLASFGEAETRIRFDSDFSLPAWGGAFKAIALVTREHNDAASRVTVDEVGVGRVADRRFFEDSTEDERIARLEQNWEPDPERSWQLAVEGAWNRLELATALAIAGQASPASLSVVSTQDTEIQERRAELTLAHRRELGADVDLQWSLGGETSTIEQGAISRRFNRPKGFVTLNAAPSDRWTLTARASREVGQISFRDFAASVSLVEEVVRETNAELVPEQSWLFSARAERRFGAGHVGSIELQHERIRDLVDRIPRGESGDAIGNIDEATRNQVRVVLTVIGDPLGVPGARLDLRGSWQRSSVTDPIEGFERDIGRLRTRDVRAEFRHDIRDTDLTYGFVFEEIELAPLYQSTLVQFQDIPPGGLTPGRNEVFLEHKNWFGFRVRATLSEFTGQKTRFSRVIYAGRRDAAAIDRVERRVRSVGGPFISLSVARMF
ncbi:MAG: hypothetical protein AAF769_09955 [Pseudomonadota bacterium]